MNGNCHRGVTLVELLVVVGLLGVLVGLLLPGVQKVRGSAARARCQNDLRQVATALHNSHTRVGHFPPRTPGGDFVPGKSRVLSWRAYLLPDMDQEPLWRQTERALAAEPWDVFANPPHVGLTAVVPAYWCPSDGRPPGPHTDRNGVSAVYTTVIGTWDIFGQSPAVRLADVTDGTANTLLLGERPPPDTFQAGIWYTHHRTGDAYGMLFGPNEWLRTEPNGGVDGDPCRAPFRFGPGRPDNPCDRHHFWSLHPGGANFAFCDGSVRFLPYSAAGVLPALATRAGGEVATPD
jgi:prepilin-type processing-associated H-X9-DG protein/prepilin-type N-terminal cleavage/methylation domain-containing protein